MEERAFKSLQQQHDEELFKYILSVDAPDSEMSDFIFTDDIIVPIKNGLAVVIKRPELQIAFPFPYHASIEGDFEKKSEMAKQTVNLDYAISVNIAPIDFIMKHLREKPNMEFGALYLVRENIRLPETTRFRIVRYFRTYPDMMCMAGREASGMILLKDSDDRKAIYSEYRKMRSEIVRKLREHSEIYRHHAFNVMMYNID